jgi:hypothetical protein
MYRAKPSFAKGRRTIGEPFRADESGALDLIAFGGNGPEQDGFFAQEGGAGMFHAAERKARNQDQVIFAEGKGAMEIFGHVADACAGDAQNFGRLRAGAVELRLAHKEPKALAGDGAKGSGGEGEQVGGQGLGFGEIGKAEAGLAWFGGFDAGVGDYRLRYRAR